MQDKIFNCRKLKIIERYSFLLDEATLHGCMTFFSSYKGVLDCTRSAVNNLISG